MHVIELVNALKSEFEELFKDYKYETKTNIGKNVEIRSGWYVAKKSAEDFPYILISPVSDEAGIDEDVVKIIIICASYSTSDEGWEDVSLMANKIKLYLKERFSICEKFGIEKNNRSIKINYPDSQPYPEWFCYVEAYFNIYNPADISINKYE